MITSYSIWRAARGWIGLAGCFMLALAHIACVSPPLTVLPSPMTEAYTKSATPPLLQTQAPTPQPTTATPPTATPTPEPGAPTDTPIPVHIIEPLVTAPDGNFGLRFDSWSLDSRWIAYWVGERAEGEKVEGQPAQLAFIDVLSGQICPHAEVIVQDLESGSVLWQADSRALVVLYPQRETLSGLPCKMFAPVENVTLPDPNTGVYLSPDGHYRAEVRILRWEEALMYKDATITDIETGQSIVTTAYIGGPHILQGPMWLTNELFLIGKTVDQGIRYIALPEGQVGNVLPDLLGLDVGDEEHIWRVDGHADSTTGEYHLLLVGLTGESGSPLLLYHSELDRLEELPFYGAGAIFHFMSFTPDGKWLLLVNPLDRGEPGPCDEYWLRPVDPPGSPAVEIPHVARDLGFSAFSIQAQKMVFLGSSSVYVFDFPYARPLGRWNAPGYSEGFTEWAPDGKRLAVMGFQGAIAKALIVVEIP